MKRILSLLLCFVLITLCCSCTAPAQDNPSSAESTEDTLQYGCDSLNLVSGQQSSLPVSDGNTVYFKNSNDGGALYSANPDLSGLQKLADGPLTSLNLWEGSLYYSVGSDTASDSSIFVRSASGDISVLYTAAGKISGAIVVNNILYFLEKDAEGQSLMRMPLSGSKVSPVIRAPYKVNSYIVTRDAIYFEGDYTPNDSYSDKTAYLYKVFTCSLSGDRITQTALQRGQNLFQSGDAVYSLVLYGAVGLLFERIDLTAETVSPALGELSMTFVRALASADGYFYYCDGSSRNVYRTPAGTDAKQLLFDAQNTDGAYFCGLSAAGSCLLAIDTDGKQWVSPIGDTLSFTLLPTA